MGAFLYTMIFLVTIGSLTGRLVSDMSARVKETRAHGDFRARSMLFQNVRAVAVTPGALRASATVSPFLRHCLYVDNVRCISTGLSLFRRFRLHDENMVLRADSWPASLATGSLLGLPAYLSSVKTLTGFPNSNATYNTRGRLCDPASSGTTCKIAAYSAFRAWCPYPPNPVTGLPNRTLPRPTTCDSAEFLQIFLALGQPPGLFPPPASTPRLAAEHNATFGSPSQLGAVSTSSNEILVSVDEIATNGELKCPKGTVATGVDSNGYPLCDFTANPCATGTNLTTGHLIPMWDAAHGFTCRRPLEGTACANSEVLYGVKPDGSLDCRNPKTAGGCQPNQVVVRYQADGTALCARSHAGALCLAPSTLVAFDSAGQPLCRNGQSTYMGNPVTLQPAGNPASSLLPL